MIQGVGIGAEGWDPQVASLSENYRCLTFDNRGFGASQPIGEPLTVDLMADDVLALMDAQSWKSAHIVGHSLGGLIALYVAHKAPGRVKSLALLCTFALGKIATRLTPRILWVGIRTRIGTRKMRRRAFLELVLTREEFATADIPALAAHFATLFGHDLADSPPVVMKQMGAMRKGDATPYLKDFGNIPTLVVSAEEDPIAPPFAARAIASGIPGAKLVETKNSSHSITVQQPVRVNALLLEHLRIAEGNS